MIDPLPRGDLTAAKLGAPEAGVNYPELQGWRESYSSICWRVAYPPKFGVRPFFQSRIAGSSSRDEK